MTWDTIFHYTAQNQITKCESQSFKGKYISSLKHSFLARLAYLGSFAVNIISFPIAIFYVTFGLIFAISYWDFTINIYKNSFCWIKAKTNHILLSALGMIFPSLAYRFRNVNLIPYVIAVRIAVITWGLIHIFTN